MELDLTEDIVKSPLDKRSYRYDVYIINIFLLSKPLCRYIKLPNELKAVIVSDETTEKASATLSVRVGQFDRN